MLNTTIYLTPIRAEEELPEQVRSEAEDAGTRGTEDEEDLIQIPKFLTSHQSPVTSHQSTVTNQIIPNLKTTMLPARGDSHNLLPTNNNQPDKMRFVPEPLELLFSTFTLLRDLIHERIGVYFEDNKRTLLADKLSHRVIERGLDSFLDYYYLLKYDSEAEEEWKCVMDALSVQETFFWREFDQIKALQEVILPQYLNNSKYRFQPLRIWSAACATGEEPLSIAIALDQAGWFDRLPIEIYASDASYSAISKAQRGIYRDRSFRSLSPVLQAKYFQPEQGGWRVSPAIHAKIKWQRANLLDESVIKDLAKAQVIFCRNVFIYFSETAIRKTVNTFFDSMHSPGYLFVGASESLLKLTTGFELKEVGGAFVYVKK